MGKVQELKEFQVYSVGFVNASVCTSLSVAEATKRLNLEHPSGCRSKWKKSKTGFCDGHTNPCPCNLSPDTHRHILFTC